MLRQLLTFFALLTGLAATAAPAHACIVGSETRVEAAFEIVVIADRRQLQAAFAPVPPLVLAVAKQDVLPLRTAPALSAVRIGIDRARE